MTRQLAHFTVDIVGRPFLTVWSPEDGVVRAAGFRKAVHGAGTDASAARAVDGSRCSDALWKRLSASDPALAARGLATEATAAGAIPAALRAYAVGNTGALDGLDVSQRETPFRGEVWRALRRVPAGQTVTYSELAALAGRPAAVRAAASGCANNLIALIVPCHRIVRANGGLGGYLFGEAVKDRLLTFERVSVNSAAQAAAAAPTD
ncbi:methylated-DNA--[protein]-cysteine S-methyltransferase [Leucobacter sp. BZR 635]